MREIWSGRESFHQGTYVGVRVRMLKSQFKTGHNFSFSGKDHGLYIAHGICQNQTQNRLLILTHHLKGPSLSFQKINVIGPSELKLWLF